MKNKRKILLASGIGIVIMAIAIVVAIAVSRPGTMKNSYIRADYINHAE